MTQRRRECLGCGHNIGWHSSEGCRARDHGERCTCPGWDGSDSEQPDDSWTVS